MKRENPNINKVKTLIFNLFFVIFLGCTPKVEISAPIKNEMAQNVKPEIVTLSNKENISKPLREAIYFSSSLEREALKLILKDSATQRLSLFGVLSYIIEINTGSKKSTPSGLDCGKYEVKREVNRITIFKSCLKPAIEIARIKVLSEDTLYDVEFLIKDWARVVGLSVALTGNDTHCQLTLKDKKLVGLSCDNWSYQTTEDPSSSTVVKTSQFIFNRFANKQFVIKGGFFKELIENRKIDIVVPMEGKIKIIEKELKVIDEFAEIIKRESEKQNEKKEIKNEGVSEEGHQENNQERNQKDDQGFNQEGSQVNQQAVPQSDQQNSQEPPRRHRGR